MIRLFFVFYFAIYNSIILLLFFSPIFDSKNIIIFFAVHPFNICEKYPLFWHYFKIIYVVFCFISFLILYNSFFSILKIFYFKFIKRFSKKISIPFDIPEETSIFIGNNSNNKPVSIPLSGLYQNILVTGAIGSGKTSSLLYPLTEQLLLLNFSNQYKSAFLILDVKGNYYKFVQKICDINHHLNDFFLISLHGHITYNPFDKPNLKPHILANRLKNILLLFSPQQTESFWIDKSEQILTEAIKLCRLYNDGYVTFTELHKLIMSSKYYQSKIELLKFSFLKKELDEYQISTLISCIKFFEDEFFSLDDRTQSILKAEISRITNVFVSDKEVERIFCPERKKISFPGFNYILKNHKIVMLDMNIAEYNNLAKIIAAYLKIDFQTEILSQLSKNNSISPSCFICDEYHEYVTSNDASFFAQSRESKSINIVATQSYSSLLASIHDSTVTKVLIQNLVNKFWFRTDDSFTIDEIMKQTGKEEKHFISKTISENARKTDYNFLFNNLFSKDSSISESINTSTQKDFIFDTNFFSRELSTFSCLAFLSNGFSILPLEKLTLTPYFLKKGLNI